MSHRQHRPEPSVPVKAALVRIASRGGVLASAAVIAAAGTGTLAAVPASAASALPVVFGALRGASAHYDANGDIVLTTPANGNAQTAANVEVNAGALGNASVPQTPPSFTVDNYSNGYPRWVITVGGQSIYGYPAQIGGSANDSFTGAQWTVGTSTTYETYQQARAQVCPSSGTCDASAGIWDDGGQAATSDTLTNIQYDGETAAPGTNLTVAPMAARALTVGVPAPDVQVPATEVAVPGALTYSLSGTLPAGMTLDSSTGVISGTPTALGTSTATITVTDDFGDTGTAQVSYTVRQVSKPSGTICSTTTGCSWERLQDPSAMVMDVDGRYPSSGTVLIAYGAQAGDPAADFTKTASGFGSSYQLTYTPYGTEATASAADPTLAADAYNADGSAKYCVSAMAEQQGQTFQLEPCTTTANALEDLVAAGTKGSYSMMEPTFGTPGVTAGSSPMAINDYQYGGDGSPLINYAATGTGNELFTPGI